MAITNHERVGKALELLRDGLKPFISRELEAKHGKYWITTVTQSWRNELVWEGDQEPHLDIAALLLMLWEQWNLVFSNTLGHAERSLVSELRDIRNKWAHQNPFSSDDAYRALDSATRLLTAISAPQADELEKVKMELLRVRFDEQVRNEKRRVSGTAIESSVTGSLRPWREVVTPHKDVANGRYQQAEFAADLWQVHVGEGSNEYRDPVEFFRRTFLTQGLKQLLVGAIGRLSNNSGDPVVQLQTNFGGGKTHSMLALYHLFSGAKPAELLGIESVMASAGNPTLPKSIRRVVLVGNKISPGNPSQKPDGTLVHTLWGELAYQLGGKPAYERIRADDERATNPGDTLRLLLNDYGPSLILIDEWVAYARQLHDQNDLPGGSFETHFSFAQTLTESAKLAKNCLLVISLPLSDSNTAMQVQDVEVGGLRGRDALHRLRNAVGRVEASWRPANADEGFEIVRRRLFEPLVEQTQFVGRDTVAKAFADLYRTQKAEFPLECADAEYEKRLKAAYPIHPEVFNRLYNDWSSLVNFQRTRGVLRLMAAVIHSLWAKSDRNPLIMPANISIDDAHVQFELTRYLPENWVPVIEKDVDGPNALPLRLDADVPNLGKYAASRRVARTVYLGSAPVSTAANRGLEDRQIKLGCVMPGESPAVFGDALRRLATAATYLYQDGPRYWYSTQPTVTKLAEDRADQLKRDPDIINRELDKRLRANLRQMGDFKRVHPLPQNGQDVPDEMDTRLVVLGSEYAYSKAANNKAEIAARAMLENRGTVPRLYRNTLVFLVPDQTRLQDLDDALRRYLAWVSIFEERQTLNLNPQQVKQAETQRDTADTTVNSRLPETYQWLLVPVQNTPQSPVEWSTLKLSGPDPLALRASKKLKSEEMLLPAMAGVRLRIELDRVPLWRKNDVSIRQLADDFARYVYLPRLIEPTVLLRAVEGGIATAAWEQETFAYAEDYDASTGRYRGLRAGQSLSLYDATAAGMIVKSQVARAQLAADALAKAQAEAARMAALAATLGHQPSTPSTTAFTANMTEGPQPRVTETPRIGISVSPPHPQRYYGRVTLDPNRVGRDAAKIAEEVIAHLAAVFGAQVKVTIEIEAEIPNGASPQLVRIVTENGRSLRFEAGHGFEQE
jgi:predicted AAA+ superfamily ATPase